MRIEPPATEPEPEGFGDAVEAAAWMLVATTLLAWVGFQWQRRHEQAAHRFAVGLIERIASSGDQAVLPLWSGLGRGPASAPAHDTFRALGKLGHFVPTEAGRCRVMSRLALCQGTRYQCEVAGQTASGPVAATIGICSTGIHVPYSFDTFDLTLPAVAGERGNRDGMGPDRDGFIRYGTVAPSPSGSIRLHDIGSPVPL